MASAIKVENLSKIYRLGQIGTGTVSADLNRWFTTKVLGKEDPFLKIGEANDRSKKGNSNIVYSLQDINFDIEQGDAVGIIGRNGAGKSTLLKLLSRVTSPTTGKINIKGRVASLLEVGTGFHPELTGKENIYLNGAILGMRKKEITRKLDEIIDFSGVERYIDTPVKRYSSGMYVRLAFAVAAHLESEILIVDEVLAVGDADFQKKCLGKMGEVSKGEGRTILFVSHNMAAVKQFCNRGIMLKQGMIEKNDNIENVVKHYQFSNQSASVDLSNTNRDGNGKCRVQSITLTTENGIETENFNLGGEINFHLKLKKNTNTDNLNIRVIIGVYNYSDEGYLRFDTKATNTKIVFDGHEDAIITCNVLEHLNIKPDQYFMNVAIFENENMADYVFAGARFTVENYDYYGTGKSLDNQELSKVYYKHEWKITNK